MRQTLPAGFAAARLPLASHYSHGGPAAGAGTPPPPPPPPPLRTAAAAHEAAGASPAAGGLRSESQILPSKSVIPVHWPVRVRHELVSGATRETSSAGHRVALEVVVIESLRCGDPLFGVGILKHRSQQRERLGAQRRREHCPQGGVLISGQDTRAQKPQQKETLKEGGRW